MGDTPASEPQWTQLVSVEGRALLGRPALVRVRLHGRQGALMEVAYPAGTESPEHAHAQDSFIYVLRGHLRTTLDGHAAELHPGEALLQPAGAPHTVTAVIDSEWLEFKAPPMVPWW